MVLECNSFNGSNIEMGQIRGLLEIMDARQDVQDIIKRAMQMKFDDTNSKILYIGHLIDQALTRPDVLALYYASKHGQRKNRDLRFKDDDDDNEDDDV